MPDERASSYDANEARGGLEREMVRLRDQARITWHKEVRNLRWWGLKDDMSLLEVGSGPGFVTGQLAELVPEGSVTALEIDSGLIERARAYLQAKGGDWHIVQGNVMNMEFPDDSFDFAYARFVFQHLPDPVGAAREILRVLKPGGKLAIADIDDDMVIFDPPATGEAKAIGDRLNQAMREDQARRGGNRLVGRRLLNILQEAGFEGLDLEAVMMHSKLGDLSILVPKPTREGAQPLIDHGLIDEREAEIMVADAELFERSDPVIMIALLMASGTKGK